MQKLPLKVLVPLIEATEDYVNLLKGSKAAAPFFHIENTRVLEKWPALFDEVKFLLSVKEDFFAIKDELVYKLSFYFDLVCDFMLHHGGKIPDLVYASAVDYFFKNFKKQVGKRHSEHLFWKAFPELKKHV